MTYNTPELFLVGTAQNVVLTGNETSDLLVCLATDDKPLGSDVSEAW